MKIILITALCLVLVKLSSAATGISVSKTIGNCQCTGLEIKDGSTQREFRLSCKKTTIENKKPTTIWHTSCIYGGDPHSCAKYNKNQSKFYEGLLDGMATDYCGRTMTDGECRTGATFHSTTICSEIPYTFNRYM